MNPFARLQNDEVYVIDLTGNRSRMFKTAVASKNGQTSAAIFEKDLRVESGWKLAKSLPGNREDIYTILDADYSPGLATIPPHWNLTLAKESAMKSPTPTPVYNINAHNVQIGDHNVQHIAASLVGLGQQIDASSASVEEKKEAKGLILRALEHPVTSKLLGAAVAGIVAGLTGS